MRYTENWSAAAKGLKEKKRRRRRTFRPFFFLPCHLEAGGVDFASLYIGSFISHPPFLFLPLLRSPRLTCSQKSALLLHSITRSRRTKGFLKKIIFVVDAETFLSATLLFLLLSLSSSSLRPSFPSWKLFFHRPLPPQGSFCAHQGRRKTFLPHIFPTDRDRKIIWLKF